MNSGQPWRYQAALTALDQGKLIAYPTESVWGLGCDPYNEEAVHDLLKLKGRSVDKGLILVAANLQQIDDLLLTLTAAQKEKLQALQARPTTWLLPATENMPSWLTGRHASIAVRLSTHPVASALSQAFGGTLVSTSANPSGYAPAKTMQRARAYFGSRVQAYVAGKTGGEDRPSQIIDLLSDRILR